MSLSSESESSILALFSLSRFTFAICASFAFFGGFGMIWQIWWLVIVAVIGAFVTFVVFAWRDRTEYEIPADEVARIDRANRLARNQARAALQAAE